MGSVRSWIIRTLILSVIAGLAWGGWVMHDWVSPERVREAVLASLREQFPDCQVQITSARLRLFGGICVTDWTLTRTGESEPFFRAESAVIAHDKEQLNHGRVVIRKIELEGPVVHIHRQADGTLNIAQIFKDGPADQPVPTVTIRNATLHFTDATPNGLPPLKLTASKLNLLNDPLPQLKIDLQAVIAPAEAEKGNGLSIPFSAVIKRHRQTQTTNVKLEILTLQLTPQLAPAFQKLSPALAEPLSNLVAQLGIKAELNFAPGQPVKHDIKLEVRDGRYEDPTLPIPVEHLSALLQIKDGKISVEKGTAKFGGANAEFSLETRDNNSDSARPAVKLNQTMPAVSTPAVVQHDPIQELECKLDRLEVTLRDLNLDEEFFSRVPNPAKKVAGDIRKMFNPVGSIDVQCKFQRTGTSWRREVRVVPNRLSITYEHFRYPVQDIGGSVTKVIGSDGADEFRLQMTGSLGGRRVELSGRIQGSGPDPLIDLKIAGTDIPIDDRFFKALPEKHSKILHQLQAQARGDFIVEVRQPLGVNRCENSFRVRVYDGQLNYVHFPYALAQVKGLVQVRVVVSDPTRPLKPGLPLREPENNDRVEFREFEAAHDQGKLWLDGEFSSIPESRDHRLSLKIQGDRLAIDEDLHDALRVVRLGEAWQQFQPRGTLTFGADLEMIDRGAPVVLPVVQAPTAGGIQPAAASLPGDPGFNPLTDLKVAVNLRGPTILPRFFAYELQDLAGVFRYTGGILELAKFSARHGESRLSLDAGQVRFGGLGEVWANLGGVKIKPFIADPVWIEALPAKMRPGVANLKPRGKMELLLHHMVLLVPAPAEKVVSRGQAPAPPQVLPVLAPPIGQPLPPPPSSPAPDPVIYWKSELRLQGTSFSAGLDYQDAFGVVTSEGKHEGQALGSVIGKVELDRVVVKQVPLSAVKLDFQIRPQQPDLQNPSGWTAPILEFPRMSALLFHGTLSGEARVELADVVRYRSMIQATNVRLEEIAQHLKMGQQAEFRGLAHGRLYLENQIDPRTNQSLNCGRGQIDIPSGRMLNLPVLLPLLKLLKMQTPDQTAFEEAHALFEIRGDRIGVSQLDLIGTAISLGGWGEIDLKADEMHFEFYTIWSQVLRRWLTTPLGDVTSFLSGNLFKIEMDRKNGEMNYKPVMLPAITEPVRGVAERLRNRLNR